MHNSYYSIAMDNHSVEECMVSEFGKPDELELPLCADDSLQAIIDQSI